MPENVAQPQGQIAALDQLLGWDWVKWHMGDG